MGLMMLGCSDDMSIGLEEYNKCQRHIQSVVMVYGLFNTDNELSLFLLFVGTQKD
jgi:hypothetical protein